MTKGLFDRLQAEIDGREKAAGLSMADVLSLPDALRQLFNWMLRQEDVSLADVIQFTGQSEKKVREMLNTLVEKGFVREMKVGEEYHYKVRLAFKRGQQLPLNIWQALDGKVEK